MKKWYGLGMAVALFLGTFAAGCIDKDDSRDGLTAAPEKPVSAASRPIPPFCRTV